MRNNALAATLGAATLLLLGGTASADGDHDGRSRARPINGAWEVTTTVRLDAKDCATAAVVGVGLNPFPSFYTFHDGGTLNEQGARASSANRGSGHGLWVRTGYSTVRYRLKFHGFDDNRLLVSTTEVTVDAAVAKGGGAFEGIGRLVQTDLSGNSRRFCLTLTGTRMSLD
jgi:hypothetical protein